MVGEISWLDGILTVDVAQELENVISAELHREVESRVTLKRLKSNN